MNPNQGVQVKDQMLQYRKRLLFSLTWMKFESHISQWNKLEAKKKVLLMARNVDSN